MGQRNSSNSNEGSERERCLEGSSCRPGRSETTEYNYYIAPLTEDICPFLEMPPNIVEIVCSFLNLRDLSSLSQASKAVDNFVGEFLRHECCSAAVIESYRKFARDYGGNLATLSERRILEDINRRISLVQSPGERSLPVILISQQESGPEREKEMENVSRVALYKMLHHRTMFTNVVQRVSLCDPRVHFPHRGSGYVTTPVDRDLGRNIVSVDNVCWLQFSTTFSAVEAGDYRISVLMKVTPDLSLPHRSGDYTEWTVHYPRDLDHNELNVRVDKSWWNKLKTGGTPQSGSNNLIVESESNSGWFRVIIPKITVSKPGEIWFDMKDVVCPYWKSGLCFDFIQLSKI